MSLNKFDIQENSGSEYERVAGVKAPSPAPVEAVAKAPEVEAPVKKEETVAPKKRPGRPRKVPDEVADGDVFAVLARASGGKDAQYDFKIEMNKLRTTQQAYIIEAINNQLKRDGSDFRLQSYSE